MGTVETGATGWLKQPLKRTAAADAESVQALWAFTASR
jgi:hypothetical protein